MKRFGESILYRLPHSLRKRLLFFLFGHDFIGAEIRLGHFRRALSLLPTFSTILDAGCGTGDFSFYVAERFPKAKIRAYDINKNAIEQNKKIQKQMHIMNIDFSEKDLLKLQEKETYDIIFSIGTFIYFSKEETKKILENLTKVLKKGGYLYLDLPQEDFLEVSIFPIQWYSTYYQALKEENSGDLYSFEEMQALLQALGYFVVFSNKSFTYFGKFAWEFDNLLREKKWLKMRYFFLPVLKLLARLDAITKHKKGCCFVILAQKG